MSYKTNEDKVKDYYINPVAKCDTMMIRNKWSIWLSGIKISKNCPSEKLAWKSAKDVNGIK